MHEDKSFLGTQPIKKLLPKLAVPTVIAQLHLKYYATDETEIVIRVLSFGPCVKVISPDEFTELIKERLREQRVCGSG